MSIADIDRDRPLVEALAQRWIDQHLAHLDATGQKTTDENAPTPADAAVDDILTSVQDELLQNFAELEDLNHVLGDVEGVAAPSTYSRLCEDRDRLARQHRDNLAKLRTSLEALAVGVRTGDIHA